jgi:transcriptional regulator with XRE-family HTH domain
MLDLEPIKRKRAARQALPLPALRRAIREQAGLAQEDLARALGIHRETISRWEKGTRTPRGDLLARYAELLRELAR